MGIFSAIDDAFAPPQTRSASVSKLGGGFFPSFSWGGDKALPAVSAKRALTLSAVYCAVEMKSDSLGVLPFGVYYRTDDGRERDRNHAVDWLLNQEPDGASGILTPFHFKKLIGVYLMLRGNCLFAVRTSGAGVPALEFIPWDDVQDIRFTKGVGYSYHIKGGETLMSNEVLHYRGISWDGVVGISVLTYAALTLNVGIELQQFSYVNAESKGTRNGVLSYDTKLDESAVEKIRKGVNNALNDKSANRFIILGEKGQYTPLQVTPQEAALIESGKLHIEDVARFFNVPLYKLKSLTQSTNNNVEQMALDYQTESILPPVTNIEQETAKKLFTEAEKRTGYFILGNMDVIVRPELKSRSEYLSKMVNSGIMTVNEARAKENMNAQEDGKVLRFPVNVQTQDMINKNQED